MDQFEKSTYRSVHSRFNEFCDSSLRKLEVVYNRDGTRDVGIYVATRDRSVVEGNTRVGVCIKIYRVSNYCFEDREKVTNQVISHGINISWFGDEIALDLGYFVDPPESKLEQLTSKCYVLGAHAEWKVVSAEYLQI